VNAEQNLCDVDLERCTFTNGTFCISNYIFFLQNQTVFFHINAHVELQKRRHNTEAISEYLHAVDGFRFNLATLTEHCRGYIWLQLAESFMGLEELNSSTTISLWNTSHQDPK